MPEGTKSVEGDRQKFAVAKPNEAGKSRTDPSLPAANAGTSKALRRCKAMARTEWSHKPGWGAIALGDTDCGVSWAYQDKALAEGRALDHCKRKTQNCRIVEVNQK